MYTSINILMQAPLNASHVDTCIGDGVLRADVGLDLVSLHWSDLTEVGVYVILEEEGSMVPLSFVSSQL